MNENTFNSTIANKSNMNRNTFNSTIAHKSNTNLDYDILIKALTPTTNNSNKNFLNLDFGPCGDDVRLSPYGLAIKNNSDNWVSYNSSSGEIINVNIFNFKKGGKYCYKIPVAVSSVKIGDIVIHNKIPVFVTKTNENETFEIVDVRTGETKNIIPTKNIFGFNFMTKVVNLLNPFMKNWTSEQPFGNLLPFLLMEEENCNLLPLFFMSNSPSKENNTNNLLNNPMILYFMLNNNKKEDFNPLLLLLMDKNNNVTNIFSPEEKEK